MGVPHLQWKIHENPIKMDDLEAPPEITPPVAGPKTSGPWRSRRREYRREVPPSQKGCVQNLQNKPWI